MKVAELEGALLDYWAGRAYGLEERGLRTDGTATSYVDMQLGIGNRVPFSPSTDWAQAGPILARMIESGEFCVWEHKGTVVVSNHDPESMPCNGDWNSPDVRGEGSTLLLAAMQALVASKFGEKVEDAPSVTG